MQAHPQSSPAARINALSRPKSPFATGPQPASRLLFNGPSLIPIADSTGLAHDAGNLLSALGLYCDLLRVPGVLRPEHGHYATELSLISDRSAELIRRLLARPTAELIAVNPKTPSEHSGTPQLRVQTSPTCEDADYALALRNLAPVLQGIAAGVAKVSVTGAASVPALGFSSEILERISVNLVRNAVAAIREQRSASIPATLGHIRVHLSVLNHRLQLTVEDNGPGMPPAAAAAFLQPMPLAPGITRGLGHRIIHELAALTAGQLSIRVRPGNGTIFCLRWPIHSAPSTESSIPNTPATSTQSVKEGSRTC